MIYGNGSDLDEEWRNEYNLLRSIRPDLYERCIQIATVMGFNHSLSDKVTAEIEHRCVQLTLDALERV